MYVYIAQSNEFECSAYAFAAPDIIIIVVVVVVSPMRCGIISVEKIISALILLGIEHTYA